MRARVIATLALTFLVLAAASGQAQVPPLPPPAPPRAAPPPSPPPPAPGFVSAYEILRTLRSAGFDPLAPPLREGTVYVARATDYRGILMRVVLDARTGAIRDANRIVPGPGNYAGPYGGVYGERAYGGPYGPGPYSSGPYGSGPYGSDPYDAEDAEPDAPGPYGRAVALPYGLPPQSDVPATSAVTHPPAGTSVTPLPRPRPPELASRKAADDAKPSAAADAKPAATVDPKPDAKPDLKPNVTTAAPAAAPAPTAQTAAPAKPGKAPSALSIAN